MLFSISLLESPSFFLYLSPRQVKKRVLAVEQLVTTEHLLSSFSNNKNLSTFNTCI